MLLQVVNIVENSCQLLQTWKDDNKICFAALKCIEAVCELGVLLPVQHMIVLSEVKGENEKLATKILKTQGI